MRLDIYWEHLVQHTVPPTFIFRMRQLIHANPANILATNVKLM